MKRMLFASHHCYLDQSNGAPITTRQILLELSARGWEVDAFCGAGFDYESGSAVDAALAQCDVVLRNRVDKHCNGLDYTLFSFVDRGIKSIVFDSGEKGIPSPASGRMFLRLFESTLRSQRPEIVVTYGGYWFGSELVKTARMNGAKTVVLLQNFAYHEIDYFHDVDLTITPSHFASGVYRERLGLRTTVIPPLIDWQAIKASSYGDASTREYVLFVNPDSRKGAPLFARIVSDMAEIRPDVRFLVVEGSAQTDALVRTGVDLTSARNLYRMKNTGNVGDFYSRAKLTLIPSFFDESFGRVAAESLIACVPVVASNRGALPETLGNAAILLGVPEQYTPESNLTPTPDDAAPWIHAILRLWDDSDFYKVMRAKCDKEAQRWRYSPIADQYESAFSALLDKDDA